MKIATVSKINVIRNGKKTSILPEEIVLDDLLYLNQVHVVIVLFLDQHHVVNVTFLDLLLVVNPMFFDLQHVVIVLFQGLVYVIQLLVYYLFLDFFTL